MKLTETRIYVGPSLYAWFPVIRLTVDLGPLEEWPSVRLGSGFRDGLLDLLPGLHEHRCSWGEPGGFVRRMNEDRGTWLGHVLEHTAIELQSAAGHDVSFGRAREAGVRGVYHVIYQYRDAQVGESAGRLARDILASLLPHALRPLAGLPDGFDARSGIAAFHELVRSRALGPSTAALVAAAERRHIPWQRLDDDHLIQFGHGSRQRRMHATITGNTSEIAVDIASDKALTATLLDGLGMPVPRHELVRSAPEALDAAARIGYPVVVKPRNGNHGRGVTPHVRDPADLYRAFLDAREHGDDILVEEHLPGFDHRILVVGDVVAAAARRVPGHIVGDGEHTVEQLVDLVNTDPRRGPGHDNLLTLLEVDAQALRLLALQGLAPASVPMAGEMVCLRATGNLSTGGTAVDVTDEVHPENAALAVRAARAIGLDVAGIDFITEDIGRPWRDGGGICEVNAAPGLRMHIAPAEGTPRDVAGAIMDQLFPHPDDASIPIAAITGTNGKTTTARMTAHILSTGEGGGPARRPRVGLATSDGIYIDGVACARGDMSGPVSAQMVLRDPGVDVAVLETARGGLLRAGLAFRRCTVGAVLNVTRDHIGIGGIDTVEELAELKRIAVEVAQRVAVLNADDDRCLAMREHITAQRTCLVSMRDDNPHVAAHTAAGGMAVLLQSDGDGGRIVLEEAGERAPIAAARTVPATLQGSASFNTQNALFATAIARGMGASVAQIRDGLASFDTSFSRTPGRLNICDVHPFRVVLDYGHNAAAVAAMGRTAEAMAPQSRRICVIAAPGDRLDEDIRAIARAAAPHFHNFVCRHDEPLRGRGPLDVPGLLRDGLLHAGVPAARIAVVPDERDAITAALRQARVGDLVVVFGDAVEDAWRTIVTFEPGPAAEPPDGGRDAGAEQHRARVLSGMT
jgi:cyanophycin synthetase